MNEILIFFPIILGIILAYGAHKGKSTLILTWIIWAIVQCIANIPIALTLCDYLKDKNLKFVIFPIMYLTVLFIFNICTILTAKNAISEIDREKSDEPDLSFWRAELNRDDLKNWRAEPVLISIKG